ncbi:MAG: hypothetical protein FGF50_08625 [Candidatus Brockarchaeota archaeon]|nr:hypothetical protein [Candidatus Brockarchaeota archaeon]
MTGIADAGLNGHVGVVKATSRHSSATASKPSFTFQHLYGRLSLQTPYVGKNKGVFHGLKDVS